MKATKLIALNSNYFLVLETPYVRVQVRITLSAGNGLPESRIVDDLTAKPPDKLAFLSEV